MGGPEMQEDYACIPTTCIVLLVVVCKHATMASVQNDGYLCVRNFLYTSLGYGANNDGTELA
jgi:hypothetical protein